MESRWIKSEELLFQELICILVVSSCLFGLALFADAPLSPMAQVGVTPEDVHAPWIFLGIQWMLRFIPPFVAGIVIPLTLISAIAILAFERKEPVDVGIMLSRKRRSATILFIVLMIIPVFLGILGLISIP